MDDSRIPRAAGCLTASAASRFRATRARRQFSSFYPWPPLQIRRPRQPMTFPHLFFCGSVGTACCPWPHPPRARPRVSAPTLAHPDGWPRSHYLRSSHPAPRPGGAGWPRADPGHLRAVRMIPLSPRGGLARPLDPSELLPIFSTPPRKRAVGGTSASRPSPAAR